MTQWGQCPFDTAGFHFGNELIGSGLDRGAQIVAQLKGIALCAIWTFPAAYLFMRLVNWVYPLRVSLEDEIRGLNLSEHGIDIEGSHDHDDEELLGRLEAIESKVK